LFVLLKGIDGDLNCHNYNLNPMDLISTWQWDK